VTYLYVPDDDSEYGPVWEESEAREMFTADELADRGVVPAELVIDLEGWRGHYITADWLSEAADLLESCQLDTATYHLDVVAAEYLPPDRSGETFRDRVERLKHEANEAWARYHAHNDVVGADPDQVSDYGPECPRGMTCPCEFISEVADDVESLLGDLGFVTEWSDGVRTYRVGAS